MTMQARHMTVDWEGNPAPEAPTTPESLREAGLSASWLSDQLLRTIYVRGPQIGRDIAQFLCLPFKIVKDALKFLKDEKTIQVDGGDLVGEVSYRYSLTDFGRKRAEACMRVCAYIGPAPVPLEDYVEQCYRQTVTGLQCYPESLKAPFGHLVLKDDMFLAIGPAIIRVTVTLNRARNAFEGTFTLDQYAKDEATLIEHVAGRVTATRFSVD